VRTRGKNAHGAWWQIAVEKPVPEERGMYRVVSMANMSMATSGEYRNFVVENGVRLSHTIDPTTGHPINHRLASATVLHEECAMADGYATALMVLGPEKGLALAERLGLAVLLIAHDEAGGFVDYESTAFTRYVAGTETE
jgi:thiamine biosynthesis lipoprotein